RPRMATQTQRGSGASKPAAGRKPPTAFQLWFEDAWAGWLKHVSLILFAALLFVLHQLDVLNEHTIGLVLSLGISLGALVIAAGPARGHVKTAGQGAALYILCGVWA